MSLARVDHGWALVRITLLYATKLNHGRTEKVNVRGTISGPDPLQNIVLNGIIDRNAPLSMWAKVATPISIPTTLKLEVVDSDLGVEETLVIDISQLQFHKPQQHAMSVDVTQQCTLYCDLELVPSTTIGYDPFKKITANNNNKMSPTINSRWLWVRVLEAVNLPMNERISYPCIVLTVESERVRTNIKQGRVLPAWHEEFFMPLQGEGPWHLRVELVDNPPSAIQRLVSSGLLTIDTSIKGKRHVPVLMRDCPGTLYLEVELLLERDIGKLTPTSKLNSEHEYRDFGKTITSPPNHIPPLPPLPPPLPRSPSPVKSPSTPPKPVETAPTSPLASDISLRVTVLQLKMEPEPSTRNLYVLLFLSGQQHSTSSITSKTGEYEWNDTAIFKSPSLHRPLRIEVLDKSLGHTESLGLCNVQWSKLELSQPKPVIVTLPDGGKLLMEMQFIPNAERKSPTTSPVARSLFRSVSPTTTRTVTPPRSSLDTTPQRRYYSPSRTYNDPTSYSSYTPPQTSNTTSINTSPLRQYYVTR